jgi:hypothetical protein
MVMIIYSVIRSLQFRLEQDCLMIYVGLSPNVFSVGKEIQ